MQGDTAHNLTVYFLPPVHLAPACILDERVVPPSTAAAAVPEESREHVVVLLQTEAKAENTDDILGFLPHLAEAEADPCRLLNVTMSIKKRNTEMDGLNAPP